VLGQAEAAAFLAPRPVTAIFGVGKAMQARLARDGYRILADLQRADEGDLMRRYGVEGRRMSRLSRGIDVRPVHADRETKSVSAETTFERDISAFRPLEQILWLLCERVSARMKAKALSGSTVTLKLKTADFTIRTRARSLPAPTQLAERIFASGRGLLKRESDGTKFRLIGIGVSDLAAAEDADPADLVDAGGTRQAAAEHAVDRVRAKFGRTAIVKGLAFDVIEQD
jgi:DNA polymerase-4